MSVMLVQLISLNIEEVHQKLWFLFYEVVFYAVKVEMFAWNSTNGVGY